MKIVSFGCFVIELNWAQNKNVLMERQKTMSHYGKRTDFAFLNICFNADKRKRYWQKNIAYDFLSYIVQHTKGVSVTTFTLNANYTLSRSDRNMFLATARATGTHAEREFLSWWRCIGPGNVSNTRTTACIWNEGDKGQLEYHTEWINKDKAL